MMKHRQLRTRIVKAITALAVGGTALQASGCDPLVRDTLLTGLQATTTSLSSALITAFFISLDDEGTPVGAGLTTT